MWGNKQEIRHYRIEESSREGGDKGAIKTFWSLLHANSNIWDRRIGIQIKWKKKETERTQGKALKRIFKQPFSTSYTGILMESRIRFAEQRIQYATLILYQSLRNSNEEKTHQEDDTRERKKEL